LTVFAYKRGHAITTVGSTVCAADWRWADTGEPVQDKERPCVRCGRLPTATGHDACLGDIPEAIAACCGHGVAKPYVLYPYEWYDEQGNLLKKTI
jgi:hypothetical protein